MYMYDTYYIYIFFFNILFKIVPLFFFLSSFCCCPDVVTFYRPLFASFRSNDSSSPSSFVCTTQRTHTFILFILFICIYMHIYILLYIYYTYANKAFPHSGLNRLSFSLIRFFSLCFSVHLLLVCLFDSFTFFCVYIYNVCIVCI